MGQCEVGLGTCDCFLCNFFFTMLVFTEEEGGRCVAVPVLVIKLYSQKETYEEIIVISE